MVLLIVVSQGEVRLIVILDIVLIICIFVNKDVFLLRVLIN